MVPVHGLGLVPDYMAEPLPVLVPPIGLMVLWLITSILVLNVLVREEQSSLLGESMFANSEVLVPAVTVVLAAGPVMEVGVRAKQHVVLLGEQCAVLLISFLRPLLVPHVEQLVMDRVIVYGEFVLVIMDGHGVILLHRIALTQQQVGHGACIWVLAVRVLVPVIVLAVRQPLLVVIKKNIIFARGKSLGFCFIAAFRILR